MSSSIIDTLITQEDRAVAVRELDQIRKALYTNSNGSKIDLSTVHITPDHVEFWQTLLEQSDFSVATLDKLRVQFLALPVIRITLAFEPSVVFLKKIKELFSKVMKADCILEWEMQTSLCAGIKYSLNGKMIDLSLQHTLKSIDLHPVLSHHLSVFSAGSAA